MVFCFLYAAQLFWDQGCGLGRSRQLFSLKKLYEPAVHYLLSTKWHIDTLVTCW